jgi:hypothetical protein
VIAALSEMEEGAARELTVEDLRDNVVVKVADEVEVDISKSAWKVSYADAIADAEALEIDGVRIPFVSLKFLILSKETYRDVDRGDLIRLRKLLSE